MTKSKTVEQDGRQSDGVLDPKALEAIGRALRAHYDDLVHAPLPDRFVELLARLEVEERSSKTRGRRHADD
jgi:hypothetical protein